MLAPVNAPRSWPNSSLSIRSSAIAAQLTGTNGRLLRLLWAWSARDTSSLPVPLSPTISTGAGESATRSISARSRCIGSLSPISVRSGPSALTAVRSAALSAASRRRSSTRSMRSTSASGSSTGLSTKSWAPARVASMAIAMLPWPVTITTSASGWTRLIARSRARPSRPGICRSSRATSMRSCSKNRSASSGLRKVTTS